MERVVIAHTAQRDSTMKLGYKLMKLVLLKRIAKHLRHLDEGREEKETQKVCGCEEKSDLQNSRENYML